MSYIDRDKTISLLVDRFQETAINNTGYVCDSGDTFMDASERVKCWIKEIPDVDVVPVVHGKWIDMGDFISCSLCNSTRMKEFESYYGKATWLDVRTNYCPNCGAYMRGKE